MRRRDESDHETRDIYEDMVSGFWKGQQDSEEEHKMAIAKLVERGALGTLVGGTLGIGLGVLQANIIPGDLNVLRGFLGVLLPLGCAIGGLVGGVAWDVHKNR